MNENELIKDFNNLIEQIKNLPGVGELFDLLKMHDEIKKQSDIYLGLITPNIYYTSRDSTD